MEILKWVDMQVRWGVLNAAYSVNYEGIEGFKMGGKLIDFYTNYY